MAASVGAGHRRAAIDRRCRTLAQIAMACLLAAFAALVVTVVFFSGLTMLAAVVATMVLTGVGAWWFLARRGVMRWFGGVLAAAAPVVLVVLSAVAGFWLDGVTVAALGVAGLLCARAAVRGLDRPPEYVRPRYRRTARPRRPVLIMNPASGGGKVGEFGLVEKAEALGARVLLLDLEAGEVDAADQADEVGEAVQAGRVGRVGPAREAAQDVTEMARQAVADGADLLGVAGGDGTQALVAAVAAEHGLPFLVLSAGTRNHFAMDLGLDRNDPAAGLEALRDGVELRVDLGTVAGRPFVNTASFGAYAQIVQDPQYRDSKAGTALDSLPDLLPGEDAALTVHADGEELPSPQVLLVSNNPYLESATLGGGRRPRLDRGLLGVVGIRVDNAFGAAQTALLGTAAKTVTVRDAREVRIEADEPQIPVAVDGEALSLPTPVICTIRPGALRVRVPRHRPEAPSRRPMRTEWRTVLGLALGRFGTRLHAGGRR